MNKRGIIVSARPLGEKNIEKLQILFSKMLEEDIILEESIDESIVGGFKVKIGNQIWDESIKRTLSHISDELQTMMINHSDKKGYNLKGDLSVITSKPPVRYHASSGSVISVGDGIASIRGMSSCRYLELIDFGNNCYGIAMNLLGDRIECILLGDESFVQENQAVVGTGKVLEVPVGESLLGRIVDPLGRPIDRRGRINSTTTRPIECNAASIIDRKPVSKPLQTGCLAIDSMVPLGKGQRQLIIGDRQIGKTTLAIDTIINQRGKDVICVYVAIGQKASTVAQLAQHLKAENAMDYTVIVSATAADSVPMQYIAPYSGCAIAEHFMYSGKDVLIVYDDLSKHAVAYRTISLLLKRPPGREAYPGDVFYLHSRLLERSACLSEKLGGGSMTALPIVETQDGDISAYIPTNVISITDGQIFLQSSLFHSGVRPAISVGLSVSRVGGAAQTKAVRKYSGQLRLELAQYREMEVFARFGAGLDNETQKLLARGRQFIELLKQDQNSPLQMCDQAILLFVFVSRLVEDIGTDKVEVFKKDFIEWIHLNHQEIPDEITAKEDISEKTGNALKDALNEYMNLRNLKRKG